jgi:putative transcriptional regulator
MKDLTDWARVNAMTEEEIERNAAEDPDNPPWTEEEWAGRGLSSLRARSP